MTTTPSTGDGLIERVRKELFSNLAHYRQGCISERDDAKKVVEFAHALAADTIQTLQTERDAARKRYDELLFAVAKKYEGEDRHETALRYIREREADTDTRAALNSNPNTSGEAK